MKVTRHLVHRYFASTSHLVDQYFTLTRGLDDQLFGWIRGLVDEKTQLSKPLLSNNILYYPTLKEVEHT